MIEEKEIKRMAFAYANSDGVPDELLKLSEYDIKLVWDYYISHYAIRYTAS